MSSDGAELLQCVCYIRPELGEGERFSCQDNNLWHLFALFVALVCAQDNAELFSGPFLRPSHALTPEPQFKAIHSSPRNVQIFRNAPGEILANYEEIALRNVGFI